MNAFEFNKVAGAVLTALLFIFGGRVLLQVVEHSGNLHRAPAYTLPKPAGDAATAGTEAKFDASQVLARLSQASAENGHEVFKKCVACHTTDKGGVNKIGPNLYNIIERPIGKHPGFAFSPAMALRDGTWTYERLANYLHDPKGYIPNNRMAFSGIADSAELADLLAYLRSLSETPVPFPE